MDVIEIPHAGEAAPDFAQRMATEKAACGWRAVDARHLLRFPVLGADTVVELDGAILGKPADRTEAEAMLTRLSGRLHLVHTAVAVKHEERMELCLSSSLVRFAALDAAHHRPLPGNRRISSARPAPTASRGAPARLSNISTAATAASWVCRYMTLPFY